MFDKDKTQFTVFHGGTKGYQAPEIEKKLSYNPFRSDSKENNLKSTF